MFGLHVKYLIVSLDCNSAIIDHLNVEVGEFEYEFDCCFEMCYKCVKDSNSKHDFMSHCN